MLDILEEILPIGTDEWQAVEDQHNIDGVYNRTALTSGRSSTLSRTKKCQQGIQIVLQLCAEPNISFVILVIDVMQVMHQKIMILKTTTLDVAMMAMVFMEMTHLLLLLFLQLLVVVLLLVPGSCTEGAEILAESTFCKAKRRTLLPNFNQVYIGVPVKPKISCKFLVHEPLVRNHVNTSPRGPVASSIRRRHEQIFSLPTDLNIRHQVKEL
jgi:hypothetical protein